MDIEKILTEGIVFKGAKNPVKKEDQDKSEKEDLYYGTARFRSRKDEGGIPQTESKPS